MFGISNRLFIHIPSITYTYTVYTVYIYKMQDLDHSPTTLRISHELTIFGRKVRKYIPFLARSLTSAVVLFLLIALAFNLN